MLKPFVFGLSYQSADLELRNKLSFSAEEIPVVLDRLITSGMVKEALILSTCNRTELYCTTNDINFVINALCDMHNLCPRNIRQHSYMFEDSECARHLFRVISGLDSMVLGENEIVAQIKSAMNIASNANSIGSVLLGLFQMALSIEKDVRNHSEINNTAISMGNAVANFVEDYLPKLTNKNIMFIGAGQMMQQIAPHFLSLNLEKKLILNRTAENAEKLASKITAQIANLSELNQHIANYAIVIVCCASSKLLITKELIKQHHCANQLIIDLSMPMLVDREVASIDGINLLTIDDIAEFVDVGIEKRRSAAAKAEEIIDERIDAYHSWQRKRNLAPVIKRLRDESEELRQQVLVAAEKDIANGLDVYDVINKTSLLLMNKLLHQPTVSLAAGVDGYSHDELTDIVVRLYGLE